MYTIDELSMMGGSADYQYGVARVGKRNFHITVTFKDGRMFMGNIAYKQGKWLEYQLAYNVWRLSDNKYVQINGF